MRGVGRPKKVGVVGIGGGGVVGVVEDGNGKCGRGLGRAFGWMEGLGLVMAFGWREGLVAQELGGGVLDDILIDRIGEGSILRRWPIG